MNTQAAGKMGRLSPASVLRSVSPASLMRHLVVRRAVARLAVMALLLLAAASPARTTRVDLDAATAAFRAGNAAYERGDFAEAEASYAKAEAAGAADARLHYNRANALFRMNKLGPAILHYEKARKLAPTDADILYNLGFARARVADKIAETPPDFITRLLWGMHTAYSPRGGIWFALALFAAGFLALAIGLFLPAFGRVFSILAAVAAFAVLLAFSPSLAYKLRQHGTAVRAVVLQPVADLHSGPGESYELLFRAHEGTVFTIVSRQGEWLAVKLPDGRGGYVRVTKIGEV